MSKYRLSHINKYRDFLKLINNVLPTEMNDKYHFHFQITNIFQSKM